MTSTAADLATRGSTKCADRPGSADGPRTLWVPIVAIGVQPRLPPCLVEAPPAPPHTARQHHVRARRGGRHGRDPQLGARPDRRPPDVGCLALEADHVGQRDLVGHGGSPWFGGAGPRTISPL